MKHTSKRRAWLAAGLAAAAAGIVETAGCPLPDGVVSGASSGSGGSGHCTSAYNDCPAQPVCKEAVCTPTRQCEVQNVASKTPVRTADAGDCTPLFCDGHGGILADPARPTGTPCAENGGRMCNDAGSCVACLATSDCDGGGCQGGACVPASCTDGVKDGSETGKDCGGGACSPCADGQGCAVPADCTGGACSSGMCCTPQPPATTCPATVCGTAMDSCGQTVACQPAGCSLWSEGFALTTGDASAVAVDGSDDVVMAGWFTGSLDLGGGALTSTSGQDLAVAKLGPAGNLLWRTGFGDTTSMTGNQSPNGVAIDAAGNVLVAGVGLGPSGLVARLDASTGAVLWQVSLPNGTSSAASVAVAPGSGDAVVTGFYLGSVFQPQATGNDNAFVATYHATDGSPGWNKTGGAPNTNSDRAGTGVATDAAGNVFVVGYFSVSIDFGGPAVTAVGNHDVFVAKLDASGNQLWLKGFGDAGDQRAQSVAVDAAGDVIVSGNFTGAIDFGCGVLQSSPSYLFVAKLDPAGNCLWSRGYAGITAQSANVVQVDGKGDVILTGAFQGTVDFGGGPLTSAGGYDVFVAKLDAHGGDHRWSERFGSAGNQYGKGVAADSKGDLWVAGSTAGPFGFGSWNGGVPINLAAGANGLFLAKLAP